MAAAVQQRPNTSLLRRLQANIKSFWAARKITQIQRIQRDAKLDVEQSSEESVQQKDEVRLQAPHPIVKSEDSEQHDRSRNETTFAKSPDFTVPDRTSTANTKIDGAQTEGVSIIAPEASSVNDAGGDGLPDFTMPITVLLGDEEYRIIALLDTGMSFNAIHYDKVVEWNIPIYEYSGLPIQSVSGAVFNPPGQATLKVYF